MNHATSRVKNFAAQNDNDYLSITSLKEKKRNRQVSMRMAGSDADDARKYLCNITRAASLAHHGLLGKLKMRKLYLEDDLSSVPVEHLKSLISIVATPTSDFQGHFLLRSQREILILLIRNVSGCDLVTIFDSVNCDHLSSSLFFYIESQHLGTRETEALVQAMETRLPHLCLGGGDGDKEGEMSLDIEALVKYSGEGKCRHITCWSPTWYREELRTWAEQRNWRLARDDDISIVIDTLGCR